MLVGKGILVSYDTCTNFPTIRKFSASGEWRAVIHPISKAYSVSLSWVTNVGSTILSYKRSTAHHLAQHKKLIWLI